MQDCPLLGQVLLNKHLKQGEAQEELGRRQTETDQDTRQQIDGDHAADGYPEEEQLARSVATQLTDDRGAR